MHRNAFKHQARLIVDLLSYGCEQFAKVSRSLEKRANADREMSFWIGDWYTRYSYALMAAFACF